MTTRPPGTARVAAVVVNWNSAHDLPACIGALRDQTHPLTEIVVVDNASADDSRAVLDTLAGADHPVHVRELANARNRGFAGGANDGIAALGADVDAVLVCNPDVLPAPDYVAHALAALVADDRRGAVQGKLHRTVTSPSGQPVIDTTGHVAFTTRLFRNRGEGEVDRGQWDTPGEVFGVSGALALYRRAMLDDLRLPVRGRDGHLRHEVFDEDLFAFWEDVDLDWRAAMRGWSTWYEPTAVARHERGGAGPRRTARVEQLNWQNRLLTLVKDDTWTAVLRALPGLLVTTLLKTGELVLTVPSAFAAAMGEWRLVGTMLRKRRQVHGRATVPSAVVVDRWFTRFDYAAWVRTWWRRVRGVPVGHEPPPRAAQPMSRVAHHLVPRHDWEAADADAPWAPPSLADEGFVHLSFLHQVDGTVQRHFAPDADLVVLTIDLDRLSCAVRVEGGFPHAYGALDRDAILAVAPYRR